MPEPKTLGRVDWMSRLKVWRVIRYKGAADIPAGDYPTQKEAEDALRELVARGNPTPVTPEVTIEHRGTEPAGRAIGDKLGIAYDGKQEKVGMQFTDVAKTGTTFYANTLEGARTKLAEKRRLFGKEGGNPMKTETERKSLHERIFGKGSTPPLERLGKGETMNNLLPMSPVEGPPLPKMLALKWPWKK